MPDLSATFVVVLPPGFDVDAAASTIAGDPRVEWAEPDRLLHASFVPDDPLFPSQWALSLIDAPLAWDTATGTGTVVAVVDTGIDETHPDIAASLWTNPGEVPGNGVDDDGNGFTDDLVGWDFVDGDARPEDRHGHGTHVAGIAAATTDNALGIAGIGFGARVMVVKGVDDDGAGYVSDLAEAVVYAAENGADVINNSWGGGGSSQVLVDAVDTATALGVVVVAAAGNSGGSADGFQPASIPGVIAVGATSSSDHIASFSSHGNVLSVAAPGVDVLSLRAAGATGLGSNGIVQQIYQRLSGTSMASPHVAGLAAVLLSAMPALQPQQVRWHLEMNADQPGYPGYETEPWNPYFGWGRIDAGRVFDPVPVTTRLSHPPTVIHGISGATTSGVASLDIGFTSIDPVDWTVATPSWLVPSIPGGSGDGSVGFAFDATPLVPGEVTGNIQVSAPTAADGGGSRPVTAYVHRDERAGEPMVLATDIFTLTGRAGIASDGVGSVVVWHDGAAYALRLARIDGAGTAGPPITLHEGFPPKWMLDVAFDGRNYLVTWFEAVQEGNGWRSAIKAMRVSADGTPIDATPFTISELKAGFDEVLRDPGVAFDGQAYTVIWEDHKGYGIDSTRIYARRIGADGTLRGKKPVLLYPDKGGRQPGGVDPEIGCANGRCLVAWTEFDGEVAPEGYYLDKGYGVMLEGGKPLATVATRIMNNAQVVRTIATDGTDFLVSAGTRLPCPATGAIKDAAVATRVTRAGTPLDLDPIRLDRSTADCPQTLTWSATFDGTNYVVPFTVLAPKPVGLRYGYYLFAARLAPDGTVLDDEMEGLLLHEQPFVLSANLTTTPLASVVTWTELTDANRDHVKARRVLPRASAPAYPTAVIGSIGTLAVPEGVDLLRTVHAPAGFDPAVTTLEASGLPPGAVFDPPTGAFRWRPDGTEAGAYPGVTFTATDGVQTASETVSVVVSEAVRSLSGIVRFGNGSRVTDAGIQISGIPREKPIAMTDRDGRWRITGLAPKTYVAKLDRATRKRYRLLGPAARTVVGTGDAVMPDVVVAPR